MSNCRLFLAAAIFTLCIGARVLAAPVTTLPWPDLGEATANSPGGGTKDAALLVAIERYPFLEDKPVTGAKRNLNDWQLFLTKTRGVRAENIVLLRDDQATREKILGGANDVAKRVQEGGTVWFLFIGHGAPAGDRSGTGLLLGVDTQDDADSVKARGVTQAELLSALGKGPQANTVAILDSCFSGRSSTGAALVEGLQPMALVPLSAVNAGTILLAAAQGNEFAGPLPGGNRPAFSYLMLAALRGWGDADANGKVTVGEAVNYARRALQALLIGRQQHPDLAGEGDSVAIASSGETGPDLAVFQRLIYRTPEPAPPSVATSASPGVHAAVPDLSARAEDSPSSGRGYRITGIVGGALGAAAIGAGVVFGAEAEVLARHVESSTPFNPDNEDRGKLFEKLQWVGYGVGAGLVATGIVFYAIGAASSKTPSLAVTPTALPGGAGLHAQGTF